MMTAASAALGAGVPAVGLAEVVVTAEHLDLIGEVASASQGTVQDDQLGNRPVRRPGEVLEVVPGLILTQHSGDGKANQYFLRGFNLDHGTDFATRVDGLPVNMPTHAHGQGYSDLNFLIPELVESVEYRKGTYYADEGDFSAAGAANIRYRRRLDRAFVALSGGQHAYQRGVVAASTDVGGGDLVMAAQYARENGPWVLPEGYEKIGALLKYTRGDGERGFGIEPVGYDGHWRSSDQIPLRAVQQGLVSRFGSIDPTDEGASHRYSVSADGWQTLGPGELRANLYAIDYRLALYSNFTYFRDPVHGDQFEQYDNRLVLGGTVKYEQPLRMWERDGAFKAGLQVRDDHLDPVGLYATVARARYRTVSETHVHETSYSAYLSEDVRITPWWRTELGARLDDFQFDVSANLAANSGTARASIASPKLTMVFGPWSRTEYFLNYGKGFHSNDARGITITVDPNDRVTPVPKVDALVRAVGAEVGVRTALIPKLQLAAALWTLTLDSELTLNSDASQVVPAGPTRRYGVELGAYYRPVEWIVVDGDACWTHARYSAFDPAEQYIPNALEQVASVGVTINRSTGWYGGSRLRYFGASPMTQSNTMRSRPSLQLYAEAGYHFTPALSGVVTVFNLLDRRDYDIEYYYPSQLRGEAAPVNDIHFHPAEPLSIRVALTYLF
jgi:outer membrane receptor protein involved in Fe transport